MIFSAFLNFLLMSTTESSSEASSEISEDNYASEYEIMSDIEAYDSDDINVSSTSAVSAAGHVSSDEDAYAWVDDPVADQEWIKKYEEDIAERKVFEEKMSKRLDGSTKIEEWSVQTIIDYYK